MENSESNSTASGQEQGRIVAWTPGERYRWPKGWILTPLDEIVLVFPRDKFPEPAHLAAVLATDNQTGVAIRSDVERLLLCISPGVSVRIKASVETYLVADDDAPRQIRITIPGTPGNPEPVKAKRRVALPNAKKAGSREAETKADREHRAAVVALFLGGGIILLVGNWILAHAMGVYSRSMAILGPPLIVAGVYFVIYPDDDKVTPDNIPLRMWIMFVLALVSGLGNMYAFSHGLY
jgi:hypothetical protein